ncbi:hypothetical protein [Microcystis phage Mae-JY04]|uniref:hypothetical protein n=1 Tax=Blastomonas sp. TaxID=1909299 RepID=UPI002588B75D|nr:hypothetical protein [Blastomonas sp.]
MSWALALLGGFAKLLRGALGIIRDYPWQSAVIGLLLALLVMFWLWGKDHAALTEELSEVNGLIVEERAAHLATIENVRLGREAARELDRQNAERVKAEAAAINERITDELEATVSTYAARNDRLRGKLAALEAVAGGGGTADVPSDPDATCRAFGAADCDDLAARMTDAQGSIDRLIALQAWATGVAEIEVNGSR